MSPFELECGLVVSFSQWEDCRSDICHLKARIQRTSSNLSFSLQWLFGNKYQDGVLISVGFHVTKLSKGNLCSANSLKNKKYRWWLVCFCRNTYPTLTKTGGQQDLYPCKVETLTLLTSFPRFHKVDIQSWCWCIMEQRPWEEETSHEIWNLAEQFFGFFSICSLVHPEAFLWDD